MQQTSFLAAAVLLFFAAAGCAGVPTPPPAKPAARATAPSPGSTCVVVRRGDGEARDARLAEHWPDVNYGAVQASFAGTVAGGERQTLLGFALPEVPAGAVVSHARISLNMGVCTGENVEVHRVAGPWREDLVTWNSFGGTYDREPLASLTLTPGFVGRVSIDVTDLARGWVDGTVENNGILLRASRANASFRTSEAEDRSERPYLEICWKPAAA